MKNNTKKVAPAAPPDNGKALVPQENIEHLIARAIDKNVDVATMEKLLNMRRELKAEWAKEQYHRALSEFQAECPVIKRECIVRNKDGSIRYRYAPIDSIVSQTKEYVKKHGFNFRIDTIGDSKGTEITAVCTVTHLAGHSECSQFSVPIDKDSYMTAAQKVASALTFAKRYAYCNVFGVLTSDDDDDSISSEERPPQERPHSQTRSGARYEFKKPTDSNIRQAQVTALRGFLKDSGIPETFVMELCHQSSLADGSEEKLDDLKGGTLERLNTTKYLERLKQLWEAKQTKTPVADKQVNSAETPTATKRPMLTLDGVIPTAVLSMKGVESWKEVIIPSGTNKDIALGDLTKAQLTNYIGRWKPDQQADGSYSDEDVLMDAALTIAANET